MNKVALTAIIIAFLGGCGNTLLGSQNNCPEPTSYSTCNEQAKKTRTNYHQDQECEPYVEETLCATEITFSGSISGTVTPSVENTVSDLIKIELTSAPDDTELVAYYLTGGDLSPIGSGRMPLFASKQNGVWTGLIDTKEYKNGAYQLAIVTNNKRELGDDGPRAFAQVHLKISN